MKKGIRHITNIQPVNASQFFLDLNMFIRERNSLKIREGDGLINSPFSFCHPYEGGAKTISINDIVSGLLLLLRITY